MVWSIIGPITSPLQMKPALISENGDYVFAISKKIIHILLANSGTEVRRITCKHNLLQVLLDEADSLNLYTLDIEGTLQSWDLDNSVVNTKWDIFSQFSDQAQSQFVSVILVDPSTMIFCFLKKKITFSIWSFQLSHSIWKKIDSFDLDKAEFDFITLEKTRANEFVVVFGKRFYLYSGYKAPPQKRDFPKGKPVKTFSSCYPHFAVGYLHGATSVFRNGLNPKQKWNSVKQHWHSQTCHSLQLLQNGNLLLSGGNEGTVCFSNIENGSRRFCSQLGAPIYGISTSQKGDYHVFVLNNNTVVRVSSDLAKEKRLILFSNFRTDYTNSSSLRHLMLIDPMTEACVDNGVPGILRFFQHSPNQFVGNLQVTQTNVSVMYDSKSLSETYVEIFAFSLSDNHKTFLATIEHKEGQDYHLKLWRRNTDTSKANHFEIETTIHRVHTKTVTGLEFLKGRRLISCSLDGKWKLWSKFKGGTIWNLTFVGCYKALNSPCLTGSTSFDGSLLALGHPDSITLWDMGSPEFEVKAELHHQDNVIATSFIGDTSFLVSGTKNQIYVWDLLSCSLYRSYQVEGLTHIIPDTVTNQFFVFGISEGHTWIVQFSFDQKEPLHVWSHPQVILAGVATHFPRHSLVLLSEDLEIFYLSEYTPQTDSTTSENIPLDFSKKREQKRPSEFNSTSEFGSILEENPLANLKDTPSHVLPSISFIFSDFMRALVLTPKPPTTKEKHFNF